MIREAEAAGYLSKDKQGRNTKGRFERSSSYIVRDDGLRHEQNTVSGNPGDGFQALDFNHNKVKSHKAQSHKITPVRATGEGVFL
jgi:hypothetical protein